MLQLLNKRKKRKMEKLKNLCYKKQMFGTQNGYV